MSGTLIPTPVRPQIGARHQFTWTDTHPEVGVFTLPDPYPTPPVLTGPGVVVGGRSFVNTTDLVTTLAPVSLTLRRGSDSNLQTVSWVAGTYSIATIIADINAVFNPPGPDFAFFQRLAPTDNRIVLVDQDTGGGASIQVRLSLTSTAAALAARDFTGFLWGERTTAAPQTVFQMMNVLPNLAMVGDVSDVYTVPLGADSVSLLVRISPQIGVTSGIFALWSDGLSPFDGSVGSLNPNTATGLSGIKSIYDYGIGELELIPLKDSFGLYPLEGASNFLLRPATYPLQYIIDPGFYSGEPILDTWFNYQLSLKPPPGMTQLRIVPAFQQVDTTLVSGGTWPFGPRLQAYAWASRQGG